MILINDISDAPKGKKIVAIGSFDGVHLGHRALLSQAKRLSKASGIPLLVYTFDPPTKVFTKGVPVLSTLSEKAELLAQAGADLVLAVPFNAEFAARSKTGFLEDLKRLEPERIVVGEDFRFGRGRQGSPDDLRQVAPTETVPLLCLQGAPVKSTRIRKLLEAGEVELARHLLGRPYEIRGIVVRGEGLGKTLGYPTANLETPPQKVLPPGVFAVRVRRGNDLLGGVANVGTRPTLKGKEKRLEVHIFAPVGDIYGQELSVTFLKRLRPEQRFAGLEALKAQIQRDIEAAHRHLYGRSTHSP